MVKQYLTFIIVIPQGHFPTTWLRVRRWTQQWETWRL